MNQNEPLGLPKGSVRAILAIIMILTICILVSLQLVVSDVMWGLAGTIIGFYFGQKIASK